MLRRIALAAVLAMFATPLVLHAARADKLKFEIYKDAKMEFRWRLKAANGESLATSGQGYKAKADCKNGVERIQKDAADKLKFEFYEDNAKQHRFRINATNGQTIGSSSQGYKNKADCEKAVDLIKKGAKDADVNEVQDCVVSAEYRTMAYDLIIANGTVVSATGQEQADVAIQGERIAAVNKGLAKSAGGAKVIDAAGKYVIPGALDVHVHLELPFCGTVSSDDWNCGTRAAARGGVTTVIDFAIPYGQESLEDAFNNWSARAKKSCIDYCFHIAITNWDRHGPEMEKMVKRGCPTFKEFMIYASEGWQSDDRAIFNALEQCKRLGAMLLIHAESARVLDELIARHHTPELMKKHGATLHAITRPNYIEAEAIQRAIMWAEVTGGRLYIVHMSTGEGADIVKAARARGVDVYAETCVQYLVLDDSVFARPDGHLFACCPQVKKPKDVARLWDGVNDGEVCVISTDTCTFTKEQKARWEGDWTKIPMGLPGLETLVPLVYTQGVLGKRMPLTRFVEKCCTNPAKIMGLYPQKGMLTADSDADIAVLDPEKKLTVDHATMEGGADWNPYQGMALAGFAQHTFSRGKQIVQDYKFVGENGWGRWLPREKAGAI